MKTADILKELANGAILCVGLGPEGKEYWLEPKRIMVRSDQAEAMIPNLKPGGDRLFDDFTSQTWRIK